MQKLTLPTSLLKNINFLSDYCEKHTFRRGGEDVVKPVQMIEMDGEKVCPRCEKEASDKAFTEQINDEVKEARRLESQNTLYRKSIVSDETILEATFDNYKTTIEEEAVNKAEMIGFTDQLQQGDTFNIILQGNPGAGKSHLAYSLLQRLNSAGNITSLFVSVDEMMRLIKDSFSNKESKYTENYFAELLSSVDYLVLDDLGAETGAIDTDKSATNFVQRVLYAVLNARQHKTTIVTMNLTSQQLNGMYDKKLVSRMLKKPKFIIFKEAKDKRISTLPF